MHLLDLMRNNPKVTYNEMQNESQKDRTTIMRNIQQLKEMGVLKRSGSKKTGYWEIITEE